MAFLKIALSISCISGELAVMSTDFKDKIVWKMIEMFHFVFLKRVFLFTLVLMIISHTYAQDGETPLHLAAHGGHLEIIKYLVECGASVNVQSEVRDSL